MIAMTIPPAPAEPILHHTGTESPERIELLVFEEAGTLSVQVARRIRHLIEAKQAVGEKAVLGLPTGSTPIGVYRELVRMHREEGLDFTNVITFNLDEYYPMKPGQLQSYHRFMQENFFDHVNVPSPQIHIPRGDIKRKDVDNYCTEYERKIRQAGGIDLILLGIGRSGHIGFNEPGSRRGDRTRLIHLDEITRKDAASDFFEVRHVPREAITMGVGTILDAKEIILIATGEHKAPIIAKAVEEEPNHEVTASFLQDHPNATIYLDRAAAAGLTRLQRPWMLRQVVWNLEETKKAVVWLAEKTGKAILKLESADFFRNHLESLIQSYGNVDTLCRTVYDDLRKRITYPEQLPQQQNVIVFSPHPDDDVISMGGMLGHLVQQGNEVCVAYMTNGSVAVFDEDARTHLRFVNFLANQFSIDPEQQGLVKALQPVMKELDGRAPGEADSVAVQEVKAYVRYAEAIAGIEVMGLPATSARFLDLPFYRTGLVKKDPIGPADVKIILDLLIEVQPDHIFVAGDLSDPHGTHRMCYAAIKEALQTYNKQPIQKGKKAKTNHKGPKVWLYRGAWQEWAIEQADVFLPLSKADLETKIEAIFKHESQKDRARFPGAYDEREFWQRARDRNMDTAQALDALGFPAFVAAEAYVVGDDLP